MTLPVCPSCGHDRGPHCSSPSCPWMQCDLCSIDFHPDGRTKPTEKSLRS